MIIIQSFWPNPTQPNIQQTQPNPTHDILGRTRVTRPDRPVYSCWPCGVGQATCSVWNSGYRLQLRYERRSNDRFICGTARLGGQVCSPLRLLGKSGYMFTW